MKIPFNKPLIIGKEKEYLGQVFENDRFSGNNEFTVKCNQILEDKTGCLKAIMTSSCTDALEMAGLLCNLKPGDEVIMPSYTFVTTASALALRGVHIVWCDIRADTKNIDETKIESLISSKTKALVVVHYAGVACDMETIVDICSRHHLFLIEDAAQAIDCYYKGNPLGGFGDLAALSFHETKNLQCGEGGALLVNNPDMIERAQFIRDKGTNRIHFNQGIVDKYTWVELGSSFLMSELQAAFLYPQLLVSQEINQSRVNSWNLYYKLLSGFLPSERLPDVPGYASHNGHMFYIMLDSLKQRKEMIDYLKERGIYAIFHYVPLHRAPFWKGKYDKVYLPITEMVSGTLLRLPLFYNLKKEAIEYIVMHINKDFKIGEE